MIIPINAPNAIAGISHHAEIIKSPHTIINDQKKVLPFVRVSVKVLLFAAFVSVNPASVTESPPE